MAGRRLGDQEVGDDLALRRQQRAEAAEPGADQRDIGGDKAVEKVARIVAADLDDAPIGEKRCFHAARLFSSSLGKGDAPISPAKLRR